MRKVALYIHLADKNIDRPLSRRLRGRAAALYFGERAFRFAAEEAEKKPRLAAPEGVFFNVSHTGALFVCAFATEEIGVDAEDVALRKNDPERLAARVLHAAERQRLAEIASPEERRRFFCRAWTQKEAAAKLSGEGLSAVLGQGRGAPFCLDLAPFFAAVNLPERFVGSLAAAREVGVRAERFNAE